MKYNEETKEKILLEYLQGNSINYLNKKYNISKPTLYTWVKNHDSNRKLNNKELLNLIKTLKNENIKLKNEIELLKKVVSFLR